MIIKILHVDNDFNIIYKDFKQFQKDTASSLENVLLD